MKYILVILLLCFGTYSEKAYCADNFPANAMTGHNMQQQQEPFYFVNPIPPAKKLLDNIDLSFFKNRLAVSAYRYRIQIPDGTETSIDRRLSVWSGWTRSDLTEIKIPRLDLEGGYKLIVEYNLADGNETRRFEVPFYVYYSSPVRTASNGGYSEKAITEAATRERKTSTGTVTEKKTGPARTVTLEENTEMRTSNPESLKSASSNRTSRKIDPLRDLSSVKLSINVKPQVVNNQSSVTEVNESKPDYPVVVSKINDSLLIPEENIDTVYIAESLTESEGIIPAEPDTAYLSDSESDSYDIDPTIASDELNPQPVNSADYNVNNQLHLALLSGQNDFARDLITGGADLNLKNNSGFTPLHIAVMLNNEEIVKFLIINGADVNAAGNSGYTPLHIASELNYFNTASELIFNGASTNRKTDQGLTPGAIARIQGNIELAKLLSKKDSVFLALHRALPEIEYLHAAPDPTSLNFEFNLPYDNTLVRKRHINNVLRLIAAPVFVLSTSGFMSFKSKANSNFSMSRIAETEAMAKTLYDKGVIYNRTANIAGSVSIISAYAIIHTTLRKKNITTKMAKVF